MIRTIVLLSGGMDSATALYAVAEQSDVYDIVSAMFFRYGQRGCDLEMRSAASVLAEINSTRVEFHGLKPIPLDVVDVYLPSTGVLESDAGTDDLVQDPDREDDHGNPITFMPGRNLVFLAMAASYAYEVGARCIVGGWNQIDVEYPDCTAEFLKAAEMACACALGADFAELSIYAPVIDMSKAAIIGWGELLGVPWEQTRSCYGSTDEPCGDCDSCRKRADAFKKIDLLDPLLYDQDVECPECRCTECECND